MSDSTTSFATVLVADVLAAMVPTA
jgi:hypothetical protein